MTCHGHGRYKKSVKSMANSERMAYSGGGAQLGNKGKRIAKVYKIKPKHHFIGFLNNAKNNSAILRDQCTLAFDPQGARMLCRKYLADSVRLPCACAPSRVFGRAGGVVTRCVGSPF